MTTQARVDHAALFAVLSSLADNKQTLGRRYAYWCNGAPTLEAAVAAAAMTQTELGHARTLYPLLEDFIQADPVQVEPMTRTLHYSLAALDRDFTGWCDFVAANFLVDTAFTTFFEAAQDSSYEPLRVRARKIVQEENLHRVHAEGWVRRLSGVGGAVREALIVSLDHFWDETLCWAGPPDDPTMLQLCREEIIDAEPDQWRLRFLQKIMPVLKRAGIEYAAFLQPETRRWGLTPALSWSHWDATARRQESRA